tara:strand:+ start:852 stop:1517 length:666 start_codon:yes stop_codon:yes gene_type:complete
MTLAELIHQLSMGTGEGVIGSGGTADAPYGAAYSDLLTTFLEDGRSKIEDWSARGNAPFGAGADWAGAEDEGMWSGTGDYTPETSGAKALAARLANMFGYTGGGPPEGTTWHEIGLSMNPVTIQQLLGAQYGSMRPGIDLGVGSLTGELAGNLGKVRSGGFASSGFADKKRQIARDVFGKKATDILVSEGKKRQDYMQSLIDQSTANQEIMQSWFPAGGGS